MYFPDRERTLRTLYVSAIATRLLLGKTIITLINFYSPLNGRSTYINTKTIQWKYEKQIKQHDIYIT